VELFRIIGLRNPVALINCEELYPHLFAILRDWQIKRVDPTNDHQPVITIQNTTAGFQRQSRWLSKPKYFRNPIDAVCDFIVDLIHAYIADNEGMLCLHCAAVEFKQGLVIFPNTYRSGKSIISVKLASCGGRLFSDDVLPITGRKRLGVALGILPRLRLPLPELADQKFIDFVAKHEGPKNSRYLYVNLNEDEQPLFGTTSNICGITILQRDMTNKPQLVTAKKNFVLKDVILRNFARQNPALEILDQLYSIVEGAECYTLRYSDLDQAVALVEDVFGL
jgi:hypothetical protein